MFHDQVKYLMFANTERLKVPIMEIDLVYKALWQCMRTMRMCCVVYDRHTYQ